MSREDVLHKLIDVATGRSNLPQHEADALHEDVTPGYTAVPPSEDEMERARATLAAYDEAQAKKAAPEQAAQAQPDPAGV